MDEKGVAVSLEDEIFLGSIKAFLPFGRTEQPLLVKHLFDIKNWCYSYSPGVRHGPDGSLVDNTSGMTRIQMGLQHSSIEEHYRATGAKRLVATSDGHYHFDQKGSKNKFL